MRDTCASKSKSGMHAKDRGGKNGPRPAGWVQSNLSEGARTQARHSQPRTFPAPPPSDEVAASARRGSEADAARELQRLSALAKGNAAFKSKVGGRPPGPPPTIATP